MDSDEDKPVILAVDDSEDVIDILRGTLEPDYRVIGSSDGYEAIRLVQTETPIDLVLLDVMMPSIDGYAVCIALKEDESTRDIPVIFLSGLKDLRDQVQGFLSGGVDFITKPIQPPEVLMRVQTHLQLRKMQKQLQRNREELEFRVRERTEELEREREKYRKSEVLYRSLMEASPDSVFLVNQDGRIELSNKGAHEHFGYSAEELAGKPIDLLVPECFHSHKRKGEDFLAEYMKRDSLKNFGFFAIRKDGTKFPVDISLSLLKTEIGSMVIADVRDTSARDQMQQELRQAQKMESLGQLTGGIAHDFNNILSSILGYTGLALEYGESISSEKREQYLKSVYSAGERARDLIRQMMAFSRKSDREELHPLELTPLLIETVEMLRPVLPSSVALKIDLDDDLPLVRADPVQINQVVLNMCINARDALREKGLIDLKLRRTYLEERSCTSCREIFGGNFIEIIIKDNGSGIEPGSLARIFEPFFTTKDVGKGTGMGLSVVHGIVHSHGGHILVDSIQGEGTSFHLLFPLSDNSPSGKATGETEDSSVYISGSGKQILVVDDEKPITIYLEQLLESRGFAVNSFSESKDALAYFTDHPDAIDLLISDQTMPGMTGIELIKFVKAHRPELPVILCSGYSSLVDRDSAKQRGVDFYLEKPFTSDELLAAIRDLLFTAKPSSLSANGR